MHRAHAEYVRSSLTMPKSLVNTPVKGPKFSVIKNIMGACMIAAQRARRISVAERTLNRKNPTSRRKRPRMNLSADWVRKIITKHMTSSIFDRAQAMMQKWKVFNISERSLVVNSPAHQPTVNFEVGLLWGVKPFLVPIPHIYIGKNATNLSKGVGQADGKVHTNTTSL